MNRFDWICAVLYFMVFVESLAFAKTGQAVFALYAVAELVVAWAFLLQADKADLKYAASQTTSPEAST